MPASAGPWFTENVSPFDRHSHRLKKIIVQKKTRFQKAILADSYSFGRCLILDGELQSAQKDEFIYHEALVHPAMVLRPKARDILILGGGEGATLREIVRYPLVTRVTMVDIDGEVVQFCRDHLRSWHQGAFDHPKTQLVIADALKYIAQTDEQFDIIMSDLPTPRTGDALRRLYSAAFYKRLVKRLKPGGVVVVQSGSGHVAKVAFQAEVRRKLRRYFRWVRPYYAFVPSFDEPWSFLIAGSRDPQALGALQVDKALGTIGSQLRFYDGQTHEGLFRIPKYLRKPEL